MSKYAKRRKTRTSIKTNTYMEDDQVTSTKNTWEGQRFGHISEYKEAKDRFEKLTEKEQTIMYPDSKNHHLENIVENLCGEKDVGIPINSSLFYDLIFYSDFIQLKDEMLEKFYSKLCDSFLTCNLLPDIINNLERLEVISHVKNYIAQGFFKVFQVTPIVENQSLILRYSKEKIWHNVNLNQINEIVILPCGYKIMVSNSKFDLSHLNFLMRLFKIGQLGMKGCNLNGRDIEYLFKDLELECLNLSECGTSVNDIIQKHSSGSLKNLVDLDISKNPIFNKTLEKIRSIPLKRLNIGDCIKVSGKFINSVWFAERYLLEAEGEQAAGDVDSLWTKGILKKTIEVLNISNNPLCLKNLKKILKLRLKELDITQSLKVVELTNINFPDSLKILKMRKNKTYYHDFKALCKLQLERLELDYYGNYCESFSSFTHFPLIRELKELSVGVFEASEEFISFISKFRLKNFECVVDSYYNALDSFIFDFPDERRCLEALTIKGYVLDMSSDLFLNIMNLNLKKLSLSATNQFQTFRTILSSEKLQKSIVYLNLSPTFKVGDDDLIQIAKCEKLETLAFSFSDNISEEYLKLVVEMKSLKELELRAKVSQHSFSLKLARLLCIAPVNALEIHDDCSIDYEALEYLVRGEYAEHFAKKLVKLRMLSSTIDTDMAIFLKNIDWEEIVLDHCHMVDSALKLILDNESLLYTLDYLFVDCTIRSSWEDIAKLHISKLEVWHPIHCDAIPILSVGQISKFLRVLSLETNNRKRKKNIDLLLETSVSQVDAFGYN